MKKFGMIMVASRGLLLLLAALALSFPARAEAPAAEFALAGPDECHTQGITVSDGYLFASCVARKAKQALILRYQLPPGFPAEPGEMPAPEIADITVKAMYHPSGLDRDGKCVWAAAAHYRSFMARSRVMCLDPKSLAEVSSFEVDDHIGAVAVMGETLVGFNWDSREIYRFGKDGEFLGKDPSPGSVAYQDCQGIGRDTVWCSGAGPGDAPGKFKAVIELLRFHPEADPAWTVESKTQIAHSETSLGREGFAVIGDYRLFLPDDFPGARLLVYPMAPE